MTLKEINDRVMEEQLAMVPSVLQVLAVWLTGEGPEDAVYGMLASVARQLVEKLGERGAFAVVTAAPVLLTREVVADAGELLAEHWPRLGVPRPLSSERAAKLVEVLVEALEAANFWGWQTAQDAMVGEFEANRLKLALSLFQVRAHDFVAHLEAHLPAEGPP